LYILDLIYKSYGHALQFASELYCKEANHWIIFTIFGKSIKYFYNMYHNCYN
jgi:hypothetical protein